MAKHTHTHGSQAYLHGKPVCIGDRVYDCNDGWGCVESVSCGCLWVKVGKRTRRKYNSQGFTGRRSRPTLFFQPPPAICLSKDPAIAQKQRELLEQTVALLNEICPHDKVSLHPCESAPVCGGCGECDQCGGGPVVPACGGCGGCDMCCPTEDPCPTDEEETC